MLKLEKISRLHMADYLCVASNGIPPSASKGFSIKVQCKSVFLLPRILHSTSEMEKTLGLDFFLLLFDYLMEYQVKRIIAPDWIGLKVIWGMVFRKTGLVTCIRNGGKRKKDHRQGGKNQERPNCTLIHRQGMPVPPRVAACGPTQYVVMY